MQILSGRCYILQLTKMFCKTIISHVVGVLFWLNGSEGVKCLDSLLAVDFRISGLFCRLF